MPGRTQAPILVVNIETGEERHTAHVNMYGWVAVKSKVYGDKPGHPRLNSKIWIEAEFVEFEEIEDAEK